MKFSAKMFVCSKNVVPLHRQIKNDGRSLILGYGVMVTQQILVLFFLVRVRVAQQRGMIPVMPLFVSGKHLSHDFFVR